MQRSEQRVAQAYAKAVKVLEAAEHELQEVRKEIDGREKMLNRLRRQVIDDIAKHCRKACRVWHISL